MESEKRFGSNSDKNRINYFYQETEKTTLEPICLGGTVVPFANSAIYLGVFLDNRPSFRLNMLALYVCKQAMGRTWCLNLTAVVRPIIIHGVIVCWRSLEKTTHWNIFVNSFILFAIYFNTILRTFNSII